MPTPLIYRGLVYVLGNSGLLDAYELRTGREIYRQRLEHQGSGFSASPVAADDRIYLPSEDGDIFVVRSGPAFKLLATNSMGEPLMATPALADRHMYVRGSKHLFAVGRGEEWILARDSPLGPRASPHSGTRPLLGPRSSTS